MPEPNERRRAERISSDFKAELYLIFPEVSFQPVPFLVQVMDASREGLRIRVPRFTQKQFERLNDKIEYGLFILRNEHNVVRVYCLIIRKDCITLPDGGETYELGLKFDLRGEATMDDVDFILERAKRQEIAYEL